MFPEGIRGRLTALAILLIPLILFANYVLVPLVDVYSTGSEDIEGMQDDITRYRRLIGQQADLEAADERLQQAQPLKPYLINGNNQALAAANLQRLLQDAAAAKGVRVLSLRVQNPRALGPLERVSVEARLQSDTPGLRNLLHTLETSKPYLFVDDMRINVRTNRRRNAIQDLLDVQLTLYGLREPDDARGSGARNG
ncbi:type II secretion system protein GspM [Thiosocius teredinicola]|uniref:type II secretion system protein GspM n=1 Tax=Thiosocius teredinicola TaxID=1973002 RepID=UPI000990C28E